MTEGNTGMNALIGAAASVLLAFLPFSTVLGGAIAGYLQRGDYREGAIVGAASGLIALLPVVALGGLVGSVFLVGPSIGMPSGFAVVGMVFLLFALFVVAVYFVGFGALGGVLGTYVRYETDIGPEE